MEHLDAQPTGTLFKAHRGELFNKVIHITTNKQLSFAVRIPASSECELIVRDRNDQQIGPGLRDFSIMWLNVADLFPGYSDLHRMDVKEYLEAVVQIEPPDVLILSSTGHAFDSMLVPSIMEATGHTLGYQVQVGADRGVFSAGVAGTGILWLDEDHENNIEEGIVIEYDWF